MAQHLVSIDESDGARQRFHIEVYVAPEVAEQRIAAVLTAGGTSSMTAPRPRSDGARLAEAGTGGSAPSGSVGADGRRRYSAFVTDAGTVEHA